MILIFGTAVIVAAMIIRQGIPDAGLAEAHTSDVLETMTVTPDYAWGMNAESPSRMKTLSISPVKV